MNLKYLTITDDNHQLVIRDGRLVENTLPVVREMVVLEDGTNVRAQPSLRSLKVETLNEGRIIVVQGPAVENNIDTWKWRQINWPEALRGRWIAEHKKTDPADKLIEPVHSGQSPPEPPPAEDVERAPLTGDISIREYVVDGKPLNVFRFPLPKGGYVERQHVAVTTRALAYAGRGDLNEWYSHTTPAVIEDWMRLARDETGAQFVQVYVPHWQLEVEDCIEHFNRVVTVAEELNMLVIGVLDDSLWDSGNCIKLPNMGKYHGGDQGHKTDVYYRDHDIHDNFVYPYYKEIVRTFGKRKGMGAWVPINEPGPYKAGGGVNPAAVPDLLAYLEKIATIIYQEDSTHPIICGAINCDHLDAEAISISDERREEIMQTLRHYHGWGGNTYMRKGAEASDPFIHEVNVRKDRDVAHRLGMVSVAREYSAVPPDKLIGTQSFFSRAMLEDNCGMALQWNYSGARIYAMGLGGGDEGLSKADTPSYTQIAELMKTYNTVILPGRMPTPKL